jgi:hypothetical protein
MNQPAMLALDEIKWRDKNFSTTLDAEPLAVERLDSQV